MRHFSQEQLAEKCNLHPTYIGQLERGEKNATLESVHRIASGLNISLEQLFSGITASSSDHESYVPNKIAELLADLSQHDQLAIYNMIVQALKLKS
ncbi:HTH-type transcriptional regulator DdrOC [Lachnospiraceae bacterium]|nr:HTH-type transcriptional regulator DdrOC [Lachnospiraceae bacterium]